MLVRSPMSGEVVEGSGTSASERGFLISLHAIITTPVGRVALRRSCSAMNVLPCDEWVEICLRNYSCKRCIFVVNHTDEYAECITYPIAKRRPLRTNRVSGPQIIRSRD